MRRNCAGPHDELESLVERRTLALRKLSARLMRVQDEERRRIARELHDGLGQWLAAAQINVDMALIHSGNKPSPMLQETRKIIEHAVSSIRTMSYLLHPPLLDEAGFEAAAHWFIDGFSKRTSMAIRTNFTHPDCLVNTTAKAPRMPEVVELALFRALQEGLTNAHRHSASPNVEVKFQRFPDLATLEVQDFGKGLPTSRHGSLSAHRNRIWCRTCGNSRKGKGTRWRLHDQFQRSRHNFALRYSAY